MRRFLRVPTGLPLNLMPPEQRERLQQERRTASAYVCERLREAGVSIESIGELVNSRASFPDAIPTLIALLEDPRLNDDSIFMGVVQALRDPAAKGVAYAPLIRLYRQFAAGDDPVERMRMSDIAGTIGYVAQEEHVDEVLELIKDRETYGSARLGLVDGLLKMDYDRLIEECRWMIRDPDLVWQVLDLIVRRSLIDLMDDVREVAETHPRGDFRARARKALARLEKRIAQG